MKMQKLLSNLTVIQEARRLVEFLPYIRSGFRAPIPMAIDLELTNRCNLACGMCWFHGSRGLGDRYVNQELSLSEVCCLLDQIGSGSKIYLGGGEPFMRHDIMDILSEIKRRRHTVSFATNGTKIDRDICRDLIAFQADHINFSLDGYEALHDRLRGAGVFQRVTEAIRQLASDKKQHGSRLPLIGVNLTLTPALIGSVDRAIREIDGATGNGVDQYKIHHYWFITEHELEAHRTKVYRNLGVNGAGAEAHLVSDDFSMDGAAIAEEISVLLSNPRITSFPSLDYDAALIFYSDGPAPKKDCVAVYKGVVVKPNGDVKFCPDEWIGDYILGNIRTDSLMTIWNNSRARKFRRALFWRGTYPSCKRCSWMYSH